MCTNPNYAIYIKKQDDSEPAYLKFLPIHPEDNYRSLKAKYGKDLISLPCGHCEQCRKDYATTWAVRCALEAEKYEYNWFITLTYDNLHVKKLNKKDIQQFFDNLSGKKKKEFKYWVAGEYGPLTNRPHYHLILFNFDIKGKPYVRNDRGNVIYTSELIEKAWGKGHVQIQEAGDNAMAYCAKYAMKNAQEGTFKPMMSKGIGLDALIVKQDFINRYGYIQGKGGKRYKIPRYYFKKIQTEEAQKLKERQIQKGKERTALRARYQHLEYDLEKVAKNLKDSKGRRDKI